MGDLQCLYFSLLGPPIGALSLPFLVGRFGSTKIDMKRVGYQLILSSPLDLA